MTDSPKARFLRAAAHAIPFAALSWVLLDLSRPSGTLVPLLGAGDTPIHNPLVNASFAPLPGTLLPVELAYPSAVLVVFLGHLAPARHRVLALLLLGLPLWWVLLGPTGSLAAMAFSCAIVLLAHANRFPLRLRIPIALVLWCAYPATRVGLPDGLAYRTFYVAMVWSALAYSSVYLIVERARGTLEGRSALWDFHYLLALPRVVQPFFQPISPMILCERADALETGRSVVRASSLGLFAVALIVAQRFVEQTLASPSLPAPVPSYSSCFSSTPAS